MLEDIGECVRLAAAPGGHVLQDGLFAEIEVDDLRHVAVDRLVVGNAGADCIGERHIAGNIGIKEARRAEHRVGPEDERIEESVVDPAVDHIDALRPFGRAHIDDIVAYQQIAAFDEFDAELIGQKGMFVIGRIILAGREQHDRRLGTRRMRRDGAQRGEQSVRIILDRRDPMFGEEIGRQPHHHLAVLQHVGDAGRGAQIVFEHIEIVFVDADDVDAGDMDIDVVRDAPAGHFGLVIRIAEHNVGRHDAALDDLLRAINVGRGRD